MGQPCSVLAFRKRLKNAGYFDIHIISDGGFWIVSACEPLGGYRITVREKNLDCFFRRKLRGGGFSYRPSSREFTDQRVNQQQEFTDQQVNQQEFTDQRVNQQQEFTDQQVNQQQEFTNQRVNQQQEFTDQRVNQQQEFTDQQVNQHTRT